MALFDIALAVRDWIEFYLVQPILILLLGIFFGKLLEQILVFVQAEFRVRSEEYHVAIAVLPWIVYIGGAALALSAIHLLNGTIWFLIGAIATVVGISIILNLRDFIPNVIAHHTVRSAYPHGAQLQTKFASGTVISVQLTDTHVRTHSGDDVYIPNATLLMLTAKRKK